MEFLALIASRPVVIALAIFGGVIATVGAYLVNRPGRISARTARFVLHVGYGLSGASVALFIVAGFLS